MVVSCGAGGHEGAGRRWMERARAWARAWRRERVVPLSVCIGVSNYMWFREFGGVEWGEIRLLYHDDIAPHHSAP